LCLTRSAEPKTQGQSIAETAIWKTYLPCLNLVHPPGDHRFGQDQLVLVQPLDIRANGAFNITEFVKVDVIDLRRGRLRRLDQLSQLRRAEGEHATPGMMEEGDLSCAQQSLRDDKAPKRIPSAHQKLRKGAVDRTEALRNTTRVPNDVCVAFMESELCERINTCVHARHCNPGVRMNM
jgi:hypothetical protein